MEGRPRLTFLWTKSLLSRCRFVPSPSSSRLLVFLTFTHPSPQTPEARLEEKEEGLLPSFPDNPLLPSISLSLARPRSSSDASSSVSTTPSSHTGSSTSLLTLGYSRGAVVARAERYQPFRSLALYPRVRSPSDDERTVHLKDWSEPLDEAAVEDDVDEVPSEEEDSVD